MRRKEIEKRINDIFSESVPDVLDNILKICEEKKGFEDKMKVDKNKKIEKHQENKKDFFKIPNLVGGLACAFVAVFCFIGLYRYKALNSVDTIIEFDVNPSVELKVDKDDDVIEAIPLNNDGKKVLGDMEFDNVDLDIAVNAIVGSMIKNGYLTVDENSILVSVKNKDAKKENKLQDKISKEIDEILKSMSIDGSILSQSLSDDNEIEKIAKKYDISVGKAKLVNGIIKTNLTNSKGEAYTEESLSKLSINELNLLLTSKNTKVENVTSSGSSASEKSYIGKEKAKDIAFKDANVSSSSVYDLEVELDCDDGKLVYEVDFKINGNEYEYEINAKDSKIMFKEVDKDD